MTWEIECLHEVLAGEAFRAITPISELSALGWDEMYSMCWEGATAFASSPTISLEEQAVSTPELIRTRYLWEKEGLPASRYPGEQCTVQSFSMFGPAVVGASNGSAQSISSTRSI